MDAVLLTWRWQNILSIWIIVLSLVFIAVFGGQLVRRMSGAGDADA